MHKPKVAAPNATTAVDLPRVAARALVPPPPPAYDLPDEVEEVDYIDETLADGAAHQTSQELRPLGARAALHETDSGRHSDTAPTLPATRRLR